jgi:hypothetical protein
MARRPGPVRKSVKDTLDDVLVGHREAAINGPAAVVKYFRRVFEGQVNLPLAVRPVAHDRMAEAQAQLQDWEACARSVELAIQHLPEMVAEFSHTHREMPVGVHLLRAGDSGVHTPRGVPRGANAVRTRRGARSEGALRSETGLVGVGRWVRC